MGYREDNMAIVNGLINTARREYACGYEMANGGNMSARIPGTDLMIVKGTNVGFCDVDFDSLVVTDFDGNMVEGTSRPTKEALLHGALYKKLPELGAIMHNHSPFANAWGNKHDALEFSTLHSEFKFKVPIPVFDCPTAVVGTDYFPVICAAFDEQPQLKGFILKKHGPVGLGKTIEDAAFAAELMEETAKISILQRLA